MGKKRRSRRQRRRYRYLISILIFSFSTLLFLHTQLPDILYARVKFPIVTTPKSTAREIQKPQTWFQTRSPSTKSERRSTTVPVTRAVSVKTIPKGPYPLLPLNKTESKTHEGTSWAASLHKRETGNLPLHWLAELIHAAPEIVVQPTSSIFTGRRKGAWIGCDRPTWLVCKGAYKAIKKTNAVTIVDTGCEDNKKWLPDVIEKLRSEFRLVRLTCIGKLIDGYGDKVKFLDIDPFTGSLPNGTDLLLAFKFVENGTLISAMKFFKNVKKAGVKYLLTENFPEEENVVKMVDKKKLLRLNSAMPPFWFPAPEYEYENKEENVETVRMQIVLSRVVDLFEEKLTPGMEELVDPRKRTVQE